MTDGKRGLGMMAHSSRGRMRADWALWSPETQCLWRTGRRGGAEGEVQSRGGRRLTHMGSGGRPGLGERMTAPRDPHQVRQGSRAPAWQHPAVPLPAAAEIGWLETAPVSRGNAAAEVGWPRGVLRAFKAERTSRLGLLVQSLGLEGKFEICAYL